MLHLEQVPDARQCSQPGQQLPQHLHADANVDDVHFGIGLMGVPAPRGHYHHVAPM